MRKIKIRLSEILNMIASVVRRTIRWDCTWSFLRMVTT